MTKLISLALLLSLFLSDVSPSYIIPLRTIDPNDTDFKDLQAFREAIGDARIVMLGEQNHGDGSSMLARARLVKFLHEEMGFNVLAMETSLLSGKNLQQHKEDQDSVKYWNDIRFGIMKVWAHSKPTYPLWEYLYKERSLKFVGFDAQIEDDQARYEAVPDLQRFLHSANIDSLPFRHFFRTIKKAVDPRYFIGEWKPEDDERRLFNQELDMLLEKLQEVVSNQESGREGIFYLRWLKNVKEQENRSRWNGQKHARDSIMAENLLWIADTYYPDQKIICWGATRHFIRNPWEIHIPNSDFQYEAGYATAGNILRNNLADDVYILATTEYKGVTSRGPWPKGMGYGIDTLETSSKGSLENFLNEQGMEYGIVNFRDKNLPDSLKKEISVNRSIGAVEMEAVWPNILDGVLFINTMEPNERKAFWR